MSKLSKLFKSDAGKIAAPLLIGYAKKQSADVRKVAPVVETILQVREAVKASGSDDVLKDTVYAVAQSGVLKNTGVSMSLEPQVATVAPVKPAFSTSTFKIGTIAALLTPLIPVLYKLAENYIGTLPPNSWMAAIAPPLLATVYAIVRYLTTNGERQASATVAAAQALAAQPQVPETINAQGGDVTVGSTPRPANAIPESVEWREDMPDGLNDDAARDLQAQAVIEQEAQNGRD